MKTSATRHRKIFLPYSLSETAAIFLEYCVNPLTIQELLYLTLLRILSHCLSLKYMRSGYPTA